MQPLDHGGVDAEGATPFGVRRGEGGDDRPGLGDLLGGRREGGVGGVSGGDAGAGGDEGGVGGGGSAGGVGGDLGGAGGWCQGTLYSSRFCAAETISPPSFCAYVEGDPQGS